MLTARIAQRIADEVMSGHGYNVNVMNERGVIIGSGSKSRIGSFHETAMRVIEQGETIMVAEDEAAALVGVRPGINMPIRCNGTLVGVVGITGAPEEVKGVAQLVRMAAELIVEQEENMQRYYMHRNDKNAFVISLLNDAAAGNAKGIANWAMELGYDMTLPRVACLIDSPGAKSGAGPEQQERRLNAVKQSEFHQRQDISVSMGANILVFKALKGTAPWEIEGQIAEYVEGIQARVEGEWVNGLRCCVGAHHPGIPGYGLSYSDAGRLQARDPAQCGLEFTHRRMSATLFDNLPQEYRESVLQPYIAALKRAFGEGAEDAVQTARILLQNGFGYDDAAQNLYVHKNTVAFRRKKLEKCLRLNPRQSAEDQLLLMLVLMEFDAAKGQ